MMANRDMPGYRHESDTSRAAAESLTTAQKYREALLKHLDQRGLDGSTIDEFSAMMRVPPNAVSGRFSELVEKAKICKTPQRRKTRSGKPAVVYVKGSWIDRLKMKEPISMPEQPASQLAQYKALQASHGHGHVIPRNDGRREGCGGVHVCRVCRQVQSYFNAMREREGQ